jgi:pimeloyl-ACP methyl ester carboxylesterase
VELEIAYAKSRGLNVAYSLTGDGPIDLVLVPGFVSHLEAGFELPAVERAVRRLARFARVISFDKPGTGLSDPIDGPQTLEQRMEDLTAVLDAAGAEQPALFGISEGAPMSALFAATTPTAPRLWSCTAPMRGGRQPMTTHGPLSGIRSRPRLR